MPELGNIEFSKLTSLIGLAPFARSSGQYNGKRSIFAGRSNLRKVLYMAAVASLRCNHKLKAFYDRLINNHKPPKVALVAVMRKLLCYMHTLLKNNSFWDNYHVHF
jgi:transposase